MASVEQQSPSQTNGAIREGAGIAVENPATGAVIGTVADMTPEEVARLAALGRVAQPGWDALGFEGRGRVLLRAQKWILDNADRVIETIVSETGKTYEDAQLAEVMYGASAFGFWAHHA
jgi:acyl-CoA reductase-like NAD-dependent aldehyde dehydrogenase